MQEVNLTKHSYMAKQLSRKVIDALERSISGFKHDIILEIIHVVLRGVSWNQIHFLPGLAPRPQKEDLIVFQWFTVCFSCDRDDFLKGSAAKSCSNPQIWTKQKHQTRSWDACDSGTTTRTRKKRPSGWKPLKTCHNCICIIPSHAREQRNKHLARAPTPLIIPVDEYRD